MSELVFTEYVRCLASGHEPPGELHDRFWTTLRGALVAEMKRRSLWRVPPARMSFTGTSWSHGDDALEELLHDCYVSVVLERLRGLAAQLEVRPEVEGLVFRNLKNFLTTFQKRFDPVGYRIYERLRDTVRRAVGEGRARILEGEGRIDNQTLLGLSPSANAEPATAAELSEHAQRWADDLLPDLVLAGGCRQKEIVLERLGAHLDRLSETGIGCFRFKDLVDALKSAVRPRWHAVRVAHSGETAVEDHGAEIEIVGLVRPEADYEERERYARLLACVDEKLDHQELREKTREYLRRLWEYTKALVAEDAEKRPGQRQLSELLGIPRDRFPELDGLLRRWVSSCRQERVPS